MRLARVARPSRALFTALWTLVGCGSTEATEPQLSERLSRILVDSATANGVIGAQAAVRIPGRQPWLGVTGSNAPGDPMRSDLLIGTGSITKMYTAVAALLLIDRGIIALGDTVGRWYPNTPNVNPSLTLERLLQHTSGLADYHSAPGYAQIILADPQRTWQPTELLSFIGPPWFAPGTAWNASNSNTLLLGMIVEGETSQSLGAFMKNELFEGSRGSWLTAYPPAPGPLATQWSVDNAGNRFDYSARFFGPALFSSRREVHATAGDLAAFAERLFNSTLLSPGMKAAMLTIVPDDGGIPGQTGGGLGIRRYNLLGRTLYGHSGGTPNSSTMILWDPATGIVAAMSVNQDGPSHRQSHFRTTAALLEAAIADAAE